jgi:hypothetical protein
MPGYGCRCLDIEHLTMKRFLAVPPKLHVSHAFAIDRGTTVRAQLSDLNQLAKCLKQSACHRDQDNTTGSDDCKPMPTAQVCGLGNEPNDPKPHTTREEEKEGRLGEGG